MKKIWELSANATETRSMVSTPTGLEMQANRLMQTPPDEGASEGLPVNTLQSDRPQTRNHTADSVPVINPGSNNAY